jgi:hypothetical protein
MNRALQGGFRCKCCLSYSVKPIFRFKKNFENLKLMSCRECGLIFDERNPSDEELISHYSRYRYKDLIPISAATEQSYRSVNRGLRSIVEVGF